MSAKWPMVPLGEVLDPVSRAIRVEPTETYRLLGARWYAGGLFVREVRRGVEIQSPWLYRVKKGDFAYNRLFAWKGSFAVASSEHDDCFVSNEFPCFTIKADRLAPPFLWHFFKQPRVWDEVLGLSSGGTPTSRNRLKEERLLCLKIPLPPLPEQQQIASRLARIELLLAESNDLQRQSRKEVTALLHSAYSSPAAEARRAPLKDVAPIVRRPVEVRAELTYREIGIRSFGRGTFRKPAVQGSELGDKRVFVVRSGDLVFNNVFAWEGAVAVASASDDGLVGSHRFITCVPVGEVAVAEFLCFHFLTEAGLADLGSASPGGAGRNRTLGLEKLQEILVPVPPYERQLWFAQLMAKVAAVMEQGREAESAPEDLLRSYFNRSLREGETPAKPVGRA
mgnify:CR=1 FL=1